MTSEFSIIISETEIRFLSSQLIKSPRESFDIIFKITHKFRPPHSFILNANTTHKISGKTHRTHRTRTFMYGARSKICITIYCKQLVWYVFPRAYGAHATRYVRACVAVCVGIHYEALWRLGNDNHLINLAMKLSHLIRDNMFNATCQYHKFSTAVWYSGPLTAVFCRFRSA